MTARRDLVHHHDGDTLRPLMLAPECDVAAGTVLLVHDAFGVGGFSLSVAEQLVALGYVVFAADLWGERRTPHTDEEVGPLIGAMVGDRERWISRARAAYELALDQPEVDAGRVAALGHCFGGATVLELVRSGAELRGAVAVHAGLNLLDPAAAWAPAATAGVLVCTGAEDPLATPAQWRALRENLDTAGIPWELDLYSGAVHAFTNPALAASPRPEVAAYEPRAARRSWESTVRFLEEVLAP